MDDIIAKEDYDKERLHKIGSMKEES